MTSSKPSPVEIEDDDYGEGFIQKSELHIDEQNRFSQN